MENLIESNRRSSFTVFETALACVLFILFNFIFVFGYSFVPANVKSIPAVYYVASFLVEFLFAAAAWTVAKFKGVDLLTASGMRKKINGSIVGYGFLIAIVCLIFLAPLTNVFIDFLTVCGYQSILSNIEISNFWIYLVYVLISCVAPAIFEELLFRGVIEAGLKEYGEKIAVVISALIFMLMHGNAEQTVHQFIIGLVIGFIFIKTGNLWVGVIAHFFNNFISITQVFIMTLIANSASVSESASSSYEELSVSINVNPWIYLLIELIGALIWAYLGYKLLKGLILKVKVESDRINSSKETEIKQENGENATISVDGESVETVMTVEGEDLTYEKSSTANADGLGKIKEKKSLSAPVIVMFVLSGLYLFVDWILALISGFGI